MLTERRSVDQAKRVLDRRDARTQSILPGMAAVIAGGGLVWALLSARSGGLTIGDLSMSSRRGPVCKPGCPEW